MFKFKLTLFAGTGNKTYDWKFIPIRPEPFFQRIARKGRSPGARQIDTPLFLKQGISFAIGAGTLRIEDHHRNFLRSLCADRIQLEVADVKGKKTWHDVTLIIEEEVRYGFLNDKLSRKRAELTIVFTEPVAKEDFIEFIGKISLTN